jgi:hypothetical protein
MHDGKVLRRPEGHDSETVEEEELALGVDAGGSPGEPLREHGDLRDRDARQSQDDEPEASVHAVSPSSQISGRRWLPLARAGTSRQSPARSRPHPRRNSATTASRPSNHTARGGIVKRAVSASKRARVAPVLRPSCVPHGPWPWITQRAGSRQATKPRERHGRVGRLRFSSPGRGRTWLPGASAPCSGITLSDAGGQEERPQSRRSVRLGKRVPGWLRPRIVGRSVLVHRPAADHQLLARISRFLASGRAGRWLVSGMSTSAACVPVRGRRGSGRARTRTRCRSHNRAAGRA